MSGAGVVHYHLLHRPRSVPTALGPAPLATVHFYPKFLPAGVLWTYGVPRHLSGSLDTLLALALGTEKEEEAAVERTPSRSTLSGAGRGTKPLILPDVASESLRAEGEPIRGLRGWARASIRERVLRPAEGLDAELAVEASEATDIQSTSARSVSEASPSRARRRREARVGLGSGRVVGLELAGAEATVVFAPLVLPLVGSVLELVFWPRPWCRFTEVSWVREELKSSSVRSRDVQALELEGWALPFLSVALVFLLVLSRPGPPAVRFLWAVLRPSSPPARLIVLVVSMSDSGDTDPSRE